MPALKRIGILGGTFDPIHFGHLDTIQAASRALVLDEVILVPTNFPLHKKDTPMASSFHRFSMATLAVADHDRIRLSDIELRESVPSFTSITLQRFAHSGYQPTQLFFITGTDAFAEIASWHDYPAILSRSHFAVVSRSGCTLNALQQRLPNLANEMRDPNQLSKFSNNLSTHIWLVDAYTRNISSSLVRDRITNELSIGELVPECVSAYITRQALY